MPTHVRDPNLYLNDRNIYDGLKGTKKATASILLAMARQRGIILSELEPHEDLVLYVSRLTHSWHDLKAMIDLINTSDRAERFSTRTLPFKKSAPELERLLSQLQEKQAAAHDEVWKVTTTNKGKTAVVTIKYTMPDFSKSAMTQLTEHVCRIELTPDKGQIQVRHSKQDRAEQLLATVLRLLNEESESNLECDEIELENVRSNRLRSEFFTKLIDGLSGFRLVEVPSVRGNNGSINSTPTRLESRAAAALQGAIKRVSLLGRSITGTSEYKQFFGKKGTESSFYITAITWVIEELDRGSLRAELEAGFSNQSACSGFTYRVRKVWYRAPDGDWKRGATAPQPGDERRLMDLIESKAREVCREIKVEAGVSSSPTRARRR